MTRKNEVGRSDARRSPRNSTKRQRPVRTAKAADALSRAVASGALARLLTYFAVRIDDTPHLRALMRHTGLAARSVQNELSRLEQLGVIRRERSENGLVRVRLEPSHPVWAPLQQLVRILADPVNVLRPALIDVAGVRAAYVFGSLARGTEQPDSDIDLMVVGENLDMRMLARRTSDVGTLLGREVNVLDVTPDDLTARLALGRRFYRNVLKGPKRWVIGGVEQLPPVAQAIAAASGGRSVRSGLP